jgi:PIN domain nuclease of toxin-antitoxin system
VKRVLDASAILAGLNEEPGAERVAAALPDGVISAVNLAEVTAGLLRGGNSPVQVRAVIRALACSVIPADEEMAIDAGLLRAVTDRAGLSLADRFCLALARRLAVPVLTSDRNWSKVARDADVTVELLR